MSGFFVPEYSFRILIGYEKQKRNLNSPMEKINHVFHCFVVGFKIMLYDFCCDEI